MKQTINKSQFVDAFTAIRPNNFSYAGLCAMFDFFEQLDEDCGTETELDVIAICCEFTEYADLKEFQDNYAANYKTMEDVEDNTMVIMIDDESFIVQDF